MHSRACLALLLCAISAVWHAKRCRTSDLDQGNQETGSLHVNPVFLLRRLCSCKCSDCVCKPSLRSDACTHCGTLQSLYKGRFSCRSQKPPSRSRRGGLSSQPRVYFRFLEPCLRTDHFSCQYEGLSNAHLCLDYAGLPHLAYNTHLVLFCQSDSFCVD